MIICHPTKYFLYYEKIPEYETASGCVYSPANLSRLSKIMTIELSDLVLQCSTFQNHSYIIN